MENMDLSRVLENQIKMAEQEKVEKKVKQVHSTLDRFNATEKELQKLKEKVENLNVQIQALEAKQEARRRQLQKITK